MKKIESLNNARKTVLKLEKEINAISNNLSKVKNKEHTTMKKIINNINYLLTNDSDENKSKLYKNEKTEGKKEPKNPEESKIISTRYEYNSDRNIDYLFLLNKYKNNNNEKNNKQYFNRKCSSSSKINVYNSSKEKNFIKSYNTNIKTKVNNVISNNRNKIVEEGKNCLNKTNQMTYSKPRLLTEYSKRNSNNNIYIGGKNNTSYKDKNIGEQIKNIKYLSFNKNINKDTKKKNKYKKDPILNTLYYNYRDNTDNNFLKNNYLNYNNKITFSYEQPDLMNNNEKNLYEKGDNKYNNEKDILYTNKTNKISNLGKNEKPIQEIVLNMKNNYNNSSNTHYRSDNVYESNKKSHYINIDYDYSNKNNLSEKFIKREKDNDILSYDSHTIKKINENLLGKNNIEDNYNTWGPYKTQRKRRIKESNNKYYSKSLNSININNSNIRKSIKKNFKNDFTDTDNINYLLNILQVKDINEAIIKVSHLLGYEKDINKLKQLFSNCENFTFDNNNLWLSNIIKNYKRNEKYKNFCQSIMILNKIKNFEEFKMFIKKNLQKNKNGNNILNENENYLNINQNDKKININDSISNSNREKFSDNSDDIKFSNSNNFKIITEYMQTYY